MTGSPRPACETCCALSIAQEALRQAVLDHERWTHAVPVEAPEVGAQRLSEAADEAAPLSTYYGMPDRVPVVPNCVVCQGHAERFEGFVTDVVTRQTERQFDDLAKVRVQSAWADHRKHIIHIHPEVWAQINR